MTEKVNVGLNSGIISTGENANVSINTVQLPKGGLRAPDRISCRSRVVELGPHTPGRLFVGRAAELVALESALDDGPAVITTGMGGVGKTTLAHRFAEIHRDRFNPIWWIHAEDPAELEAGLAAFGRRIYPDLALIPNPDAAAWARSWLAGHEGWLVVLDNVSDAAHVAGLLGTARGGRFLLTSRLMVGWDELASPLPLDVLTPDQAADLLTRATGRPELLDGATELCQALGYLPLAVRMAAAYIRENAVTAQTYLARLAEPGGDVLAWTPTAANPGRAVARIWQVSLQKITDAYGELPRDLLRILAWFAPTDIPPPLLYRVAGKSGTEVDEALGRLASYALITRDTYTIDVHRLVQAAARSAAVGTSAEAQAIDAACGQAVRLLAGVLPPPLDPTGWHLWSGLVPHIDALFAHAEPRHRDYALLSLVSSEAAYLRDQGQVARAIPLFEQILVEAERVLGPEHRDTLNARGNVAYAYLAAGGLDRALPLFEQVLADSERVLGPDDPDTLNARNNLASAYGEAGDLGRALPLLKQTLAAHERVLGPDHRDTLTFRNNLAGAYNDVGELGRAIEMYEQTLAARERVLDADDPDVLISRNNVACVYLKAGDLARAIPLLEQACADCERVIGRGHPSTLIVRHNLADAYQQNGDAKRAIASYKKALAGYRRIQGPDHPITLTIRHKLADAYQQDGDVRRAIPLHQRIHAVRKRVLGPDHPDTLLARCHLAHAYGGAGDLARAIPLLERTFADCERVLGSDHADTLLVLDGLAFVYLKAKDWRRAIPLFEGVLARHERDLGPNHADVLAIRFNLAYAHISAGNLRRAVPLLEQALAGHELVDGPDDPKTRRVRTILDGVRSSRRRSPQPKVKE